MTNDATSEDPHLWLENVEGDDALAWVKERNATVETDLASSTRFSQLRDGINEVLDSKEKIPGVTQRGDYLYNLWKDADQPRGLWRRTTWSEYRKPEPDWEILLDVDALAEQEDESWVWHGAQVLRPSYDKALISLSPGGSDANVVREFDLETRSFVADGFYASESKGSMSWADSSGDVVFVARDFGEGTLTRSGYPRTVRRWRRGTALTDAPEIIAGDESDITVNAVHDFTKDHERDLAVKAVGFFDQEMYLLGDNDQLTLIDAPTSATIDIHRDWMIIRLREKWELEGTTYAAGALLAAHLDTYISGQRDLTVLFEPTPTTALADATWTKDHLVLNILEDVTNRLELFTPPPLAEGEWATRPVALAAAGSPRLNISGLSTIEVGAVDDDESNDLWLKTTDFISPTTLSLLRLTGAGKTRAVEPLKSEPEFFDTADLVVDQHFASSEDGTSVPYFEVRSKKAPSGPVPTLLYGYGGFEISLLPQYSGSIGRSWLERGGAYVLANIRGGGEYGPRWHSAALKSKRHRGYQDFAAVARDLHARKVTDRAHLGIQGGSNGGLLMGVMYTLYPELFGAVVCQVPLLDMKRYSHLLAGASWIAEYGDPDDPAEWKFLKTFSPYHLLDKTKDYPPLLLTTSTKDDRVHPGHARKFAATLEEMGKDVRSYENIEGGHGGATTNRQRAYLAALGYEFLWQQLSD